MNDTDQPAEQNGIEVYLRIRPSKSPSGYFHQDEIDENQFIFKIPKQTDDNAIVDNSRSYYSFGFNGILPANSKQDSVFRTVGAPAVKNVLQGFNSTVFAYGQTGSGKTYSITGGPERYSDRGIIPRAISMLFAAFEQEAGQASFKCFASYLELYNESGYDLLADDSDVEVSRLDDMPKVTMLEDEDGNYHFRNLSVNQVNTEEDALNLLFLGDTNRAIGETEMNQSSSRSHCIFTIMVEKRPNGSDSVIRSKLNLVDLAGSERVHKTNSTGQTLKEAQYINTSLFFLEMVIVALHERTKTGKDNTHIPYRNSMMTSVLRDSLGGNCKTVMIATISPEAKQTDESISTCHFAQRVALVKNSAIVNEELEPELIILRLKAELKRVREEVKFLKGENGEGDNLSVEENEDLAERVKAYVAGGENAELNIGEMTLTKIQSAFCAFKELLNKSGRGDVDDNNIHHVGDNETRKTMRNQIISLQRTVQQRDDEIKVLVEIVKNERGGDVSLYEGEGRHQSFTERMHLPIHDNSVSKKEQRQLENTKVCGVEKCLDRKILRDPASAFTWFKTRYHLRERTSEEENKALLQARFQEARDAGEVVKRCKEQINTQKAKIESIRRGVAMEHLSGIELETDAHPGELKCLSIIEENKKAYKTSLQRIRELKGSIEYIKQIMEKNRKKMQTDFDMWYAKMYELMETQPEIAQTRTTNADDGGNIIPKDQGQRAFEIQVQRGNTENQIEAPLKSPVEPPSESTFRLPPGVHLTGNKEADEDIIAFYKAKESLMARTKFRSPPFIK